MTRIASAASLSISPPSKTAIPPARDEEREPREDAGVTDFLDDMALVVVVVVVATAAAAGSGIGCEGFDTWTTTLLARMVLLRSGTAAVATGAAGTSPGAGSRTT